MSPKASGSRFAGQLHGFADRHDDEVRLLLSHLGLAVAICSRFSSAVGKMGFSFRFSRVFFVIQQPRA